MTNRARKLSETETLELYRVSLTNVATQAQIAAIMAEFGYDQDKITVGKSLLDKTRQAWDTNQQEDLESSVAYQTFADAKARLAKRYDLHRKKARIVFRNDLAAKAQLGVNKAMPRAFVSWLESIRKFYAAALADPSLQAALAPLKVTPEELALGQEGVAQVEQARAEYLREKGESQASTQLKDKAFSELDEWMRDFYDVARISLEDEPQLLESLGKQVKS